MRATTTITWLLLSLSFLLPSVCSNDDNQTTASVSKNETSATSAPTGGNPAQIQTTVSSKPNAAGTNVATTNAGKENKSSQPPTTAKPMAAIATSAAKVAAAPIITAGPTQPQAPIVTNNPGAPPTAIPGAVSTVANNSTSAAAADATSGPATAGDQGATASSNSSAVAPNAATLQTPGATLPSNTAGTTAPTGPSGNTVNVETPRAPQASTDALTNGKQPTAHPTMASKTTPKDGKDIIVGVQTASGAPSQSGNTGTTLTPTTLSRTGPPAAGTIGTKAVTTSMSATHTNPITATTATTPATPQTFQFSLNKGQENDEEKGLVKVCKRLMENLKDGNCTLRWRHRDDKIQFEEVEINGKVSTELANQIYEEINKKPTDNKTLIAILASCGALLIMIVILAVCASHHRRPYNENQQHLTEELHTVENGYHDNPTLEVMEVQPEMQEKKMALNGEFNDSWIVPIDNLLKEVPDEEDTHL